MCNNVYSVLLVDDHELFIDGLEIAINQLPQFQVVAKANSGEKFLTLLDTLNPSIVLMDISMPGMDGEQATREALRVNPKLRIVTISSFSDESYYQQMIKAGVCGFVHKTAGIKILAEALTKVVQGECYFPKGIVDKVLVELQASENGVLDEVGISKRELEVLQYISQGFTNNEIGEKLFISHKTVDNHRTKLISKTNTRNSAHLVRYALQVGII